MAGDRLAHLQGFLEKEPANPTVRYMIANELYSAGRFAEAVAALDAYLEEHEDQGAAYRLLAGSHLRLGNTTAAKEAYRQGISAARRHKHPGMAAEFEDSLSEIAEDE